MTRTLLALVLLTATGCVGSDFQLQTAPERLPDDVTAIGIDPDPRLGAPSPDSGAEAPSIWDGLGDLQIPEEYWFVNWKATSGPCEVDCGRPRFDVIDVLGRVIASFEHPVWTEGASTLTGDHFSIFDVAAGPDGTVWITETPHVVDYELSHQQYVWRADAVTGSAEWVLAIDSHGVVHLPGVGGKIGLGSWIQELRLVPDPTNGDVVWLLALESTYYNVSGSVIRLDVTDPGAFVSWPIAKTLDAELTRVFAMQAIATADGTALILGLEGLFQDEEEYASRLIPFAEDGTLLGHDIDVTDTGWFDSAIVAEGSESLEDLSVLLRTGFAPYGSSYCGGESLFVVDADSTLEIDADWPAGCFAGGLLLDAAGPTVLYGASETPGNYYVPPADQLVVHHRGEVVYTLDTFRTGLAEYEFELIRVARLQLPH
jgi:hypothetical protein